MDEHNNDPYEQQLYAVFKSCLANEQTELYDDNWLTLCHKLHLTEHSDELRSCIKKHKPEKRSISFQEFRAALLTLLDKTKELISCPGGEFTIEPQKDLNSYNVGTKCCETLPQTDSNFNTDVLNIKTGMTSDENKLQFLWQKINNCLKENVDPTTMYFISNCLGIPALPKQITQCIFEKLDQNCDGLINLDEFLVVFQNNLHEQLTLERKDEALKGLTKPDLKKRFDILTSRKTRNSSSVDMWRVAGITSTSTLLTHGGLEASEISLGDLTSALFDELKNLNDSVDHSGIQSHITILRDVLALYQEELHRLNYTVENVNGEKEKLRTDISEANGRVNALAQEIDEQHVRQEETKQNLRKQIEQRFTEITQDLSNQLSSEREISATALKSKDEQIHVLQKENHEIKGKFVNTLQETRLIEIENESLRTQIENLKQSNSELVTQVKMLAAEHDEVQSIEVEEQQKVIYLVERIKHLQSEAVLLRDQNDELTAELETLRLRECHIRDTRQDHLPNSPATRNIKHEEIKDFPSQDSPDKELFAADVETDYEICVQHSASIPCTSIEGDGVQDPKNAEIMSFRDLIIKQLNNTLSHNNKCTSENCAFRDEISGVISSLQFNSNTHSPREFDFVKSIASELETECEERTSESLRDFVVPKHKHSALIRRASITNSNSDITCEVDDSFNNQDSRNTSQNKVPSLRDYPPRKEEPSLVDSTKLSKENMSPNHCSKDTTDSSLKSNFTFAKTESIEDVATANLKIQELEATLAAEKKQLTEQCLVLERSLDLLKTEYEECEDYWAAKLEEERQLFEQEQKISDEKFSELITKMAEYEELISPIDKVKNGGRLSPIEEKFNLEQQYLDLEEEFEKWKAKVEEEISRKDRDIKDLYQKLTSLERPKMVDVSLQVVDETTSLRLMAQSNYVPTSSPPLTASPPIESTSKFAQYTENHCKLPEELTLDRILEASVLSKDFIRPMSKEEFPINDYNPYPLGTQYSMKEVNGSCKVEKSGVHRKRTETGVKPTPMKEVDKYSMEYDLIPGPLRSLNSGIVNCDCMQTDTQRQVCCVDINIMKNLNLRLQSQERKKHQLKNNFRRQQHYTERILHQVMSQHQKEVSELQCILRGTQNRLQVQFHLSAEQAQRLATADELIKDLYIENVSLTANVKRLEAHCHILTGFNAESTSI